MTMSTTTRALLLLTLGGSTLAAGCRVEEIPIAVRAAREDVFLHSTSARVVVFNTLDSCSMARDRLETGAVDEAIFDTGVVPVCELYTNQLRFQALPEEELAIAAVFLERDEVRVMASGCLIADPSQVDNAAEGIVVRLSTTEYYGMTYGVTVTPPFPSAEARCGVAADGE